MRRTGRLLTWMAVLGVAMFAIYIVVRKNPPLGRPFYPAASILVNPAGTCALVEYRFKGGERWSWMDPYALFTLSSGNAFYTVVQISRKTVLRDSTSTIVPITAHSQDSIGMGSTVFFWRQDGTAAAFPSDDLYHEWTGLRECAGTKGVTDFANADCNLDNRSAVCAALRSKL